MEKRDAKNLTYHCFFEQSGTFKNEFKKLGYNAIDYDILNDYGQTDVQKDLFKEIEKAHNGEESVFDNVKEGEYILAFFPCTYFMESNDLIFRAKSFGMKSWEADKKIEHVMKRHEKLHESYVVLCKLCLVSIKLGINLVIENPATAPHYLTRYWCLEPTFVDLDRSETGDKMKKPTQYWFIENPRGGMRKMHWMKDLPRYTVTYCQYGESYMKPTDIWTNHPNPQFKPPCKNGDKCHEPAPRGSKSGTQRFRKAKDKAVIPVQLCEHIVDICENPQPKVEQRKPKYEEITLF